MTDEMTIEAPAALESWDGRQHAYRPEPGWRSRVDPKLKFHDAGEADVDPITYEVIRHRLWTINMSHGETVLRISGSPALASLDFNMSILTETGEFVMTGPYVGYLTAGGALTIPYILSRYSGAPGVDDGDIWMVNDPWIGAGHQMDVLFACPVFVDGCLFAWVANSGHQYDLGGTSPGGWPQDAVDIYSDPFVFPPFKLVEKGEMRDDLEALYLRQSRFPDLVALDLRAQLAGVAFARSQILALCERYGASVVKSVMYRVNDSAQRALRRQLDDIPDGRWSDVRYVDEALPGDRRAYRTQLNFTKKADRLTIDNEGTDPQVPGVLGLSYVTWSGAILTEISTNMLYEQLFAVGGAERQIDYRPSPGLLTCVDYPAEVSGAIMNVGSLIHSARAIIANMQSAGAGPREDITASSGSFALAVLTGMSDRGEYFGSGLLEAFSCGTGARATRDGVDTSGPDYTPLSKLTNVEMVEQWYPILFLYRREGLDSGGAGRWRGGAGVETAITPYRSDWMEILTNTGAQDVSTVGGHGLCGGYPAPPSHFLVRRQTDLIEWFADRRMPPTVGDLASADSFQLGAKTSGTRIGFGDVLELRVAGAGGYGDPIERDPERVARDVRHGYISVATAADVHGVVLRTDLSVDLEATQSERERVRQDRSSWTAPKGSGPGELTTPASGDPPRTLNECLEARDADGFRVLACRRCGHTLGDYTANYKELLLLDEGPVDVIPTSPDPSRFLDDKMVLRRYCCPACRVLMKTETVRADEPVLPDMILDPPTGEMA